MFGIDFSLPVLLLTVLVINVVPAFMPPTWIVLAYYYATQGGNVLLLAVLGAVFSTMGRVLLAKGAAPVFGRIFPEQLKKNADTARLVFSKNPWASALFTFLYALGPLPSNAIFMIAGTARLKLVPIVIGFFAGRVLSYFLLIHASGLALDLLDDPFSHSNPIGWIIDIAGILVTVVFFLVDWNVILKKVHGWFHRKQQ